MNILHLTLKKQWFDLILSGEKREEYREIKTYWCRRLLDGYVEAEKNGKVFFTYPPKPFDVIRFRHGYAKDAPFFDIKCTGIEIREGRPEWGAEPGKQYFVLKLEKF